MITLRVPNVHVSVNRWQYILAIIDNKRTKNGQAPLSPLTSPLSSRTPMLMSASSSSVRDFGRIIDHILMPQLSPIIVHSSLPSARPRKKRTISVSGYCYLISEAVKFHLLCNLAIVLAIQDTSGHTLNQRHPNIPGRRLQGFCAGCLVDLRPK